MIRVLKNLSTVVVSTNSLGKLWTIKPKGSLTIDHNQAEKIANDLLYRYGFLQDITPKPTVHVETKTVLEQNHKGRTVAKQKKVVKKAISKRGDSR